jgi:hypothetical protein
MNQSEGSAGWAVAIRVEGGFVDQDGKTEEMLTGRLRMESGKMEMRVWTQGRKEKCHSEW